MRVYIVGVAARSFPWEDGEVWVINKAGQMYDRSLYHRWFHLHGREHIKAVDPGAEYAMGIAVDSGEVRVYTPKGWLPGSCWFPYEEIRAEFGDYFNNSFPLLIAYALQEGATEIILDGVQYGRDMPKEAWAVPCIEHYLGIAKGRGVKVVVPPASGIFDWTGHMYGLTGPGCI